MSLMNVHVCTNYAPSLIVAGALALARVTCSQPICSPETLALTKYDMMEIKSVFLDLNEIFITKSRSELKAVFNKYNNKT